MANTLSSQGLIILLRDVSGSMADSEDAKEAFNSSLERIIRRCDKGDYFLRPYKIGIVLYHRHTACERLGFAEDFLSGGDDSWLEWIKTYEPFSQSTTNIVAAYRVARDWAKKHNQEYPESCTIILNITDGEHTEFNPEPSYSSHVANKLDETTVDEVADEILAIDSTESSEVEGRCILGYLWYGHESPSFPEVNPPVKCSRIPTHFIDSLKRNNPRIIERNPRLLSEPPPYFFMSPKNYAKVSDFIEIGTTTHVQGQNDDDDDDDDFVFDGMYDR